MCVDSTYFPIFFPVKNTTGVEKTGIRRIPEGITNLALLLVIVTFFSHYWLSLPIVNAISPSICPHLFVDCCVKPFLHLLHCCCRCLLLWLRWGIWEGVKLPSLSLPCFPPPWQMQMIWGQIGVAPVKSPKIIFAQTPFNFSGCPRYICWWDRSQFLRKKKYPEVPRRLRQRRILHILLVTGLVNHIWLTIWLVKQWAFDIYPTFKVFIYTM